jgi:hypothetical protein
MANVYPYLDLGRWESYIPNEEVVIVNTQTLLKYQKSNAFAYAGSYSGKLTFNQFYTGGGSFFMPNFWYNILQFASGRSITNAIIALGGDSVIGQQIKLRCRVYTPSSNPIGSDDLKLTLSPYITAWGADPSGSYSSLATPSTRTEITVADCKDNWTLLEFVFTPSNASQRNNTLTFLSILAADTAANLTSGAPYGITPSGTLFEGGELYVDSIELERISTCDLALGTPSYSKTDETAAAANDGTITVYATSSNGPIEYALDGSTYQLSNVFTGVPPGAHTVDIRDTVVGCTQQIIDIPILEFDPPDPPEPPVGDTLIVDEKPITEPNFISWFAATGPIGYTEFECTNHFWDIPIPYRYMGDRELPRDKRHHYPIAALTEKMTFYVNTEEPIQYPNRTSLRLALLNRYGYVNLDVAPLKFDLYDDPTKYKIYCDDLTLTGIPSGIYRLAIYDSSNNGVLMISNGIEVMTLDRAKRLSTRTEYRCSDIWYGTRYPNVPDFLNIQRLRLYRTEFQPEGELSQYRAASSGQLRNVNVELDLAHTIEAYMFDDLAHRAMCTWQACNVIRLNDMYFLPKDLYKITWNVMAKLNKGTIVLYEQDFSTKNRYSPIEVINVIGSDDPLLLIAANKYLKI